MQVHEQTLKVLRNFCNINQSILIPKGTKIQSIAERSNILAEFDGEDEFPMEFAIYDLIPFLGTLDLFKNPKLEFDESYVTISSAEGGASCTYFYADPNAITNVTGKTVKIKDWEISFSLSESVIKEILKISSVLALPHLSVIGQNGHLKLIVHDKAIATSNTWEMDLKDWEGADFSNSLRIDFLKIIPGNYDVKISSNVLSCWENTDMNLKYYISLEFER